MSKKYKGETQMKKCKEWTLAMPYTTHKVSTLKQYTNRRCVERQMTRIQDEVQK